MRAIIFIILVAALWTFLGSTLQWVAALAGLLLAGCLYLFFRRELLAAEFRKGRGGWSNPFLAGMGVVRYAWAVAVSNLRVGLLIINFRRPVRPAILKVYVGEMGDLEQTIVGNSITLTPGTITIDFSADGRYVYVHALEAEDVEDAEEKLRNHMESHFGKGLNWWKSL